MHFPKDLSLLTRALSFLVLAVLFVVLVTPRNECHAVVDRYHDTYFSEENAFYETPDDDFALYDKAMACIARMES